MKIIINEIEKTLAFSHNGKSIVFTDFEIKSPRNVRHTAVDIDITLPYRTWTDTARSFTSIFARDMFELKNSEIQIIDVFKENDVQKSIITLYNEVQMIIAFEVNSSEFEAKLVLEINLF